MCTRLIASTATERGKKFWLMLDIILVLCPLFFFKYYNVVNNGIENVLQLVGLRWPLPEITYLLPVGISFYTFMAISYALDVYNEEIEVEKNIGIVGLFISFFPLILSGPIERGGHMFPQFHNFKPINYAVIVKGLRLMLWGYFMKLVVADRLGIYVDAVYNNVAHHNGTTLAVASVLYPFQVYGDLGGYSLIAMGLAQCLGIDVMANFRRPFFATSMSELWQRWHISLIKWLTDYIYTPLSFKYRRWGMSGIVLALMITFIISGLWHGATLAFILWGLIQGIYLSLEAISNKRKTLFEKRYNLVHNKMYILAGCVFTFLLFAFSQIFGRASSANEAFGVIGKIMTQPGSLYIEKTTFAYALPALALLFFKDWKDEFMPGRIGFFSNANIIIRFASYLFILVLILLAGVFDGGQFIYFQY